MTSAAESVKSAGKRAGARPVWRGALGGALLAAGCVLAAAAGPGAAASAQASAPLAEAPQRDRAFVEVLAQADSFYVHQPIRLTLRIGLDAEFFATLAVPLFRRVLDVNVQLQADWVEALPGTVAVALAPEGESDNRRLSFALNDQEGRALVLPDELHDGRPYRLLAIERVYLPRLPGELVVPGPALLYAWASEYVQDAVQDSRATDRQVVRVEGRPLALRILPLPEQGRPAAFTGAVGHLSFSADAWPRVLQPGQALELTLRIEGTGNLPLFDPPPLDDLVGFRVYGPTDRPGTTRRLLTYRLVPRDASVQLVPAVPFVFFDLGPPARYRTLRSEPIPIAVLADAPATDARAAPPDGAAAGRGLDADPDGTASPAQGTTPDLTEEEASGSSAQVPTRVTLGVLGAALLLVLAVGARRARRRS